MYSLIYRFVQNLLIKKDPYSDLADFVNKNKFKTIIDIGCADSPILKRNLKFNRYFGFDIDSKFILLNKKIYQSKKLNFYEKSIDNINFKNLKKFKKKIIILIGVFHHLNDESIKKFLNKVNKYLIVSLDPVKLDNQNIITRVLFFLDRGNFIRNEYEYLKIIKNSKHKIIKNKYLNFPYDHILNLINFKNIKLVKNNLTG
jgi:hypothetical protein